MIYADDLITDPMGANAVLSEIFNEEDVTNEVARQVLIEKIIYGVGILD